jgi:predicted RNA binding protein YcfA (HicA-like mRNA interferase family)
MSKTDKLINKLHNGTISARELATLLNQLGWTMRTGKGSHVRWHKDGKHITIATHNKHVPSYQLKQVQEYLK